MVRPFPFDLLNPGSPTEPCFTVSEIPHTAKLDQNESPMDLPAATKQIILDRLANREWNRYPQPKQYLEVKTRFADTIGVGPENLVLTVGCDQMILLPYLAAGGAGRKARIFEPAYPVFATYARTTKTELDAVVLGADFHLDADSLGSEVDVLMLVTPNNPTGNGPGRDVILEALKRNCLVFVDEAYGDYAGETVIDLVQDHPNLLVGRSLSKSLLAGVRLGFGIGHPALINVLERLLFAPYHLNHLQMLVAEHYHLIKPHLQSMVQGVVAERSRVETEIGQMGLTHWPSKANFTLFEVGNAKQTYQRLLDHGVRIRDVSSMPGMKEHLRVTIGTKEENNLFLNALSRSV